jgi:chaperone required for assembly of F1-ATPase
MAAGAAALPKRFYKTAHAAPLGEGHAVLLDTRTLKTPRQVVLHLPTRALADLIAAEWDARVEVIDLAAMPMTRLAFTAADGVAAKGIETMAEVVSYASADLLCYFAESPAALVARQEAEWGPLLDWAADELAVRLERVKGIVHRAQPAAAMDQVSALVDSTDDFTLAGLAFAVGLYGSVVLALAVWRGRLSGEAAFDLSRLDEAFQEEQWGIDDEAAVRTARRRADAIMLGQWFGALPA